MEWQKSFGGSGDDFMYSIQPTSDNGYILGGSSNSPISGNKTEGTFGMHDYWIVKTDNSGNILWQNDLGGTFTETFGELKQTPDGGYILVGTSSSGITGDKSETNIGGFDIWVIKLNSTGSIVWQNTIGGSSLEELTYLELASDGGFLIGCTSSSGISGDKNEVNYGISDYWVIKLDASGNILWQNTIGGSSTDKLRSVEETSDGGFIVAGYSNSPISGDKTEASKGDYDYWIIKLNSTGVVVWQKTYGGISADKLNDIEETTDGGFIMAGSSNSSISFDKTTNSFGYEDVWVLKINSEGIVEWDKTIGGSTTDLANSIYQTTDLGYIVGGYTKSMFTGNLTENTHSSTDDYFAMKFNSAGLNLWMNIFGGTGNEQMQKVHQHPDNTYIFGGYSYSGLSGDKTTLSFGGSDFWMLKSLPDNCVPVPYYVDQDDDEFGAGISPGNVCELPGGNNSFANGDCNDLHQWVFPFESEWCDGIDNNCDGSIDEELIACNPGPASQWQNTIGGALEENLACVEATSDGGFVLFGDSKSSVGFDKTMASYGFLDYWLVKLNESGVVEWDKTYGGSNYDYATCITPTADGGYILGGYSSSGISGIKTEANLGGHDIWILKINASGLIEWQKTIGGSESDRLISISQLSDGGYILGAESESPISADKSEDPILSSSDLWILRLDASGNIIWENTIGSSDDDDIARVVPTSDGGFIIAAESDEGISGDKTELTQGLSDYWIIKLNSSGVIEWQNTIGGSGYDVVNDIIQTNEGGFIAIGRSDSGISGDKTNPVWLSATGSNSYDYWIIKLTNTGEIEWQKDYGGINFDQGFKVRQTMDMGYLVAGEMSGPGGDLIENGNNDTDLWVLKLDPSGNIIWQNVIGGQGFDASRGLAISTDGSFAVSSRSDSYHSEDKLENNIANSIDYWIIKFGPDCVPTSEICNTMDDNCNGLIDDGVIESISISAGGATTFCQGNSVLLSAFYSGASMQWKKNGTNIPGATAPTYSVNKSGVYSAVTNSLCGSAVSSSISVTVNKNPNANITAGGPTSFCEGGSVTLTEIPVGGSSYQWYKGAAAITGATTTNYVATISGNYKCRVTKIATGCFKNSNVISVSVPCKSDKFIQDNESINVYPNPNNGNFKIAGLNGRFENAGYSEIDIKIVNALGETIYVKVGCHLNNDNMYEISAGNLSSGMYMVLVSNKMNKAQSAFIIEN